MKQLVQRWARRFGVEVTRVHPSEISEADRAILDAVRPYTMTSLQRLLALIQSVRYIARNRIGGDIAECGVWRGGSMMAVALTLLAENDPDRILYLYDTFEGMPAPTASDRDAHGALADDLMRQTRKGTGVWCEAPLDDVQRHLATTGYPADRIRYIAGKVEDTIPANSPGPLALLRLDTDWYESTGHELEHLYPLLAIHGVLILDDYGHWQGAKKATDEFFAQRSCAPFLHRIDETGRLLIKTALN